MSVRKAMLTYIPVTTARPAVVIDMLDGSRATYDWDMISRIAQGEPDLMRDVAVLVHEHMERRREGANSESGKR